MICKTKINAMRTTTKYPRKIPPSLAFFHPFPPFPPFPPASAAVAGECVLLFLGASMVGSELLRLQASSSKIPLGWLQSLQQLGANSTQVIDLQWTIHWEINESCTNNTV